jgi:hypothetical protein
MNDLVDPAGRDSDRLGQAVLADPQWLEEILHQHRSGVDGGHDWVVGVSHCFSLVVVNEFDVMRPGGAPPEADPVLIVHSNAVTPGSIPLELFEPVAGRDSQVADPLRRIDVGQFAPRHALDVCTDLANRLSLPDSQRIGVPERLVREHDPNNNGLRY